MARTTIDVFTQLETITCYRSDCGILFAVPALWQQSKRRDHSNFYCPNGHSQGYLAKSREEELAEKLAHMTASRDRHVKRADQLADDNMTLANQKRALKGVATKLRRKAASGTCAWCSHTFPDVAAHVAAEHPDEAAAIAREPDDGEAEPTA